MKKNRLKKTGWRRVFTHPGVRTALVLTGVCVAAIVLYQPFVKLFAICPIQRIVFVNNRHLTDDELRELVAEKIPKSLLTVSCEEIGKRVLKSPWIKSASVRKEFPGTLSITVEETEPLALLEKSERLFLIDERGTVLEELRNDVIPFLPIIVSDPEREKEGFSEALTLVRLLNERGMIAERSHVEVIAHSPNELCVEMDELVVKMGAGGYDEKLERLALLEEELKQRNLLADSIDLRFGDKAIVKPLVVRKDGA